MAVQIQFRRDTSSNWNTVNPMLAQGEVGYDITEDKIKIGDGINYWTGLTYSQGANGTNGTSGTSGTNGASGSSGTSGVDGGGGGLDPGVPDNSILYKNGTNGIAGDADFFKNVDGISIGSNTISNEPCLAVGLSNNIGRYSFGAGYSNVTSALGEVSLGRNNTLGGCDKGSVILGNSNTNENAAECVFLIGGSLDTPYSRQVIVGYLNSITGRTRLYGDTQYPDDLVFIIGAGTGSTRANAMEVSQIKTDVKNDLEVRKNIILTDVVSGSRYNCYMSGGTFTTTAI